MSLICLMLRYFATCSIVNKLRVSLICLMLRYFATCSIIHLMLRYFAACSIVNKAQGESCSVEIICYL